MRRERQASWQGTAKPISIKDARRKFGGCAWKAVSLTSGGLQGVEQSTEENVSDPDHPAEVSRGHSTRFKGKARTMEQVSKERDS